MTARRDPLKAELGDLYGPTHWPSLLPDEARQAWVDLRGWVEALVDRFGLEPRVVPPCWFRHNALVEALSALRDHERISFAPNASPTAAVDWFRAMREIEHRLGEVCARTQCSVYEHRSDHPRSWLADHSEWLTFVDADIHDREQQVIDEGFLVGCKRNPIGVRPEKSPPEDPLSDAWRPSHQTAVR